VPGLPAGEGLVHAGELPRPCRRAADQSPATRVGLAILRCMATKRDQDTAPGGWRAHPGVRSGEQLTAGERAADRMRNVMGSWMFVFVALSFLALWMLFNGRHGFDPFPFILLNLVLS